MFQLSYIQTALPSFCGSHMPNTPFIYIHLLHIWQIANLHSFILFIPCVFLFYYICLYYVLIHALLVSVHFRSISKVLIRKLLKQVL